MRWGPARPTKAEHVLQTLSCQGVDLSQPPRTLAGSHLEFELFLPGPRDALRAVLTSCVESCIGTWQYVRSLGFGSTPTLLNKCPHHKAAFRQPSQIRYSRDLEWLFKVRGQPGWSGAHAPPSARPRPRPRYWRDAFGPSIILPLNLFLGWLLINADLINIRL